MADQKISELTNITGANLANADEFVVVDSSADQTKAITFGELKEAFDTGTGFVRITGDTMTGDLTVPIVTITNEIELEGDAGSNALIQKNASAGRDELQIYAGGDAYQTGSRGAGIHLYGNSDNEHDGNFAVLTGPDDNGDARIIAAGREDKTHVTIGNGIWDYVDDGDDHALLNLKGADAQPALLIEGAGSTEGDIVTVTGEAMQFGHWDKASTTFTERMRIASSGSVGIGTSSPSTALDVNGTITSDGLTVDGSNSNITFTGTTGNNFIYAKQGLRIDIDSDNNQGATSFGVTHGSGTGNVLNANENGDISFYEDTGTTPKFFWDASAESLTLTGQKDSTSLNLSASLVTVGGGTLADYNQIYFDNTSGTGDAYIRHYANAHQDSHSALAFGTANNGSLAEAMRITSSGSVGIGTSSPDTKLTVSGGDIKATGSLRNQMLVLERTDAANDYEWQIQGGSSSDLPYLSFVDNKGGAAAERMRIDSSGRVGIGTSSPTNELEVHSTGDTTVLVKTSGTGDADATLQLDSAASGESVVEFLHDGVSGAAIQWFTDGSPDLNIVTNAGTNGVIDFQPNNSLAMRIDASGNMLVGKTVFAVSTAGHALMANGQQRATVSEGITAIHNRLSTDGDIVQFRKDGTTVGSIGAKSGDVYIGTGDTALAFYDAGSFILPYNTSTSGYNDNSISLGNANYRFDDIYATNGTIQTSDRNEKQDIEVLSDAETRVAQACKGLLRKFRWQDAVAEKGDDARIHFGIIAQDLQDAFTAEGLDAGRYAMFISSTWWETQTEVPAVEAVAEVLDDEGNVVTEAVEAKGAYTRTDTYETQEEAPEGATERTRLGVRYPELLAFIIAAI